MEELSGVFGKIAKVLDKWKSYVQRCIRSLGSRSAEVRAMLQADEETLDKLTGWYSMARNMAGNVYEARTKNGTAQENRSEESGGQRFSIQELEDGSLYVDVNVDQDIFDNIKHEDLPRFLEKYMTARFRGTIIGEGNHRAWVDRKGTKEYARPANKRLSSEIYNAKARAGAELDNLMKVATFEKHIEHNDEDTHHPENTGGWDYYNTRFSIPGSEYLYEGRILIEYVKNGRRFHDMTHVKETGIPMPGRNARQVEHSLYDNNIQRQEQDVKQKFSLDETDSAYMDAVERGDMETAERMVADAARAAGYTMRVYHGTPTGGFTVFRDWSYFTENEKYANRYRNASASSIRGSYETTNPMTYALYMNPGRMFDTRNPEEARIYDGARMEQGMGELVDSGLPDWTEGRDLIEYIEENELPYDTIILDEGADGGYGREVVKRGVSYVTRSNMVKSADAVTRDDSGNVIPLSRRFNTETGDIRFSLDQSRSLARRKRQTAAITA